MIEGIEGIEDMDRELDKIHAGELVNQYAIEKSTRTYHLPSGSIILDVVVIPVDVQENMNAEDLSAIARFHNISEYIENPPTIETMSGSSVDLFSAY